MQNTHSHLGILVHKQVTVMTRSYNPYNFTTEGFTSKGTNGGQHYKISEKDIWIIRRQVGVFTSSSVFALYYVGSQFWLCVL